MLKNVKSDFLKKINIKNKINENILKSFLKNEYFNQIKAKAEILNKKIKRWNQQYYQKDQPEISDEKYDQALKELLKIEKLYPHLKKNSISQKIGSSPLKSFTNIKHKFPMKSLSNIYKKEEVIKFNEDTKKAITKHFPLDQINYTLEPKIDGVSIAIRYKKGKLNLAITRGNGIEGENVTENIKTISSIPLNLNKNIDIEVRGEIFFPISKFKIFKDKQFSEIESHKKLKKLLNIIKKEKEKTKKKLINLNKTEIKFTKNNYKPISPIIKAKSLTKNINWLKNKTLTIIKIKSNIKKIENIKQIYKNIEKLKLKEITIKSQKNEIKTLKALLKNQKKELQNLYKNLKSIQKQFISKPFANARNAASGSIKLLNPKEVHKRPLDAFFYQIAENNPKANLPNTQKSQLKLIKQLGLKTNPKNKLSNNIKDLIKNIENFNSEREKLDYDTDGLVIKVNNIKHQQILGYTSTAPKWAKAYKFPAKKSITKILDIKLSIGKHGNITPIAKLKPVQLAGSLVSKASLHNFSQIEKKDIQIEDSVLIEKGGDIIPQVISVIKQKRTKNSKKIQKPKLCPSCKSKLKTKIETYLECEYSLCNNKAKWNPKSKNPKTKCPDCNNNTKEEKYITILCKNQKCKEQIKKKLIYFASKSGINIENLGEQTINLLFNKGYLKDIADIYYLENHKNSLIKLPGYKIESITKILTSITNKKQIPLDNFINSLSIENIGKQTAKEISEEFQSLNNLLTYINFRNRLINRTKIYKIKKNIVNKILDSITNKKQISLDNFLTSLNIENIDKKTAKKISKEFQSLNNLLTYINQKGESKIKKLKTNTKNSLIKYFSSTQIKFLIKKLIEYQIEISNNKSKNENKILQNKTFTVTENISKEKLIEFFSLNKTRLIIKKLQQKQVKILSEQPKKRSKSLNNIFQNKTFAITGTLSSLSRNEIIMKIEEKGGKYKSTISKNLNYIITGKNPGTKLEKAKKLNIKILKEPKLLEKLNPRTKN